MKILMVCLGNICRSPMAEGILRKKAEDKGIQLTIDSAGTGGWHVGQHPDARAIQTARQFGVDISKLVGRQFHKRDFEEFDKIFVMDSENYYDVVSMALTEEHRNKVSLLLEAHMPGCGKSVPDPYYGGNQGFVNVFRMMDEACDAIIQQITESIEGTGK